jgi:hypothetical protein
VIPADLAEAAKAILVLLRAEGIHATLIGQLASGTPLVICQNERDVAPLCALILGKYRVPEGATLN